MPLSFTELIASSNKVGIRTPTFENQKHTKFEDLEGQILIGLSIST